MKHILDKSFRYYKACDTDVKRTFDRIKRERKEAEEKKREAEKQLPRIQPKVSRG